MGFTSETFLFIFMPVSILIYILASRLQKEQLKNTLLIVFSIIFYAWTSLDTLLIFLELSVFVFLAGNLIYYSKQSAAKDSTNRNKKWIGTFVGLFVGLLCGYKYLDFVLSGFSQIQNPFKELAAPIGISFITFEAISYIVDIYRGDALPGSYRDTLLFLSFFPKLVSGPIVLWKDFQSQIRTREVGVFQISEGINRVIIGFAKKAIIADTFGTCIQQIEQAMSTTGVDTPTLWLKAILYFFEIYYDFSGYSDIAIGLCNIFGFSIKNNFNFPYISKSITEFWRRWHISLGSWFREYVYIPLGGNRKGNIYFNLLVVFLLTGVWHGANWTFFLCGGGKWTNCCS